MNCGGDAAAEAGSRLVVAILPKVSPAVNTPASDTDGRRWAISIPEQSKQLSRKTSNRTTVHNRTKTDTGRQGEYPKVLERTVLKELGKFTP